MAMHWNGLVGKDQATWEVANRRPGLEIFAAIRYIALNPTMLGLTPLGILHTAISLVAVAAGAIALVRDRFITWNNSIGKLYIMATLISCATGFGIYQHGGFGKAHALGVVTLLVLGLAWIAGTPKKPLGKMSPYIQTVGYSLTFFFHLIPGITETATRLPQDNPLASSQDALGIRLAIGLCFILFLIGAVWQVSTLRGELKGGRVPEDNIPA